MNLWHAFPCCYALLHGLFDALQPGPNCTEEIQVKWNRTDMGELCTNAFESHNWQNCVLMHSNRTIGRKKFCNRPPPPPWRDKTYRVNQLK